MAVSARWPGQGSSRWACRWPRLYLNQSPLPARRLIEAGVPVAIATDFNPGSAPSFHLPFALTLACTLLRMTPAEALKGATINAARAVGLQHAVGSLEPENRLISPCWMLRISTSGSIICGRTRAS